MSYWPDSSGRVEIGRHRGGEGREIGAEIGDGADPKAEDLAVLVECHLGMGDVVAAVRVGQEGLGAIRRPLHRAASTFFAAQTQTVSSA